jgi:cytochrome c553
MIRRTLPLALVAAALLASSAVEAKLAITLKSIEVTLPESNRMLPNAPVAAGVCVACHSAGMILNQPALSKTAWEAEVIKMRDAYKAPVDAKDVPKIVDYLAAIKGPR